jgi:drug/metabolite transporter (DMT)-like permease
VSGAALGLALGAALLHALWNLLLAGSRDSVAATGAVLLFGTALLAPAALLAGEVSADALPFVAASASLELAYFVLLARAYAGGDLGVVYPVARGSAPVLVLVVAALGLGEGVSGLAAAGVVLVGAGVLLVGGLTRFPHIEGKTRQAPRESHDRGRRDLRFGLAIGATIAGYTLVDSEGLDHADPLPYLFLIAAICAAAYCGALLASGKGRELKADLNARAALTAAATFGAYAMVLAALELAPPAPVAAVRESSIVIAALMAWLFLGEPRRLTGAVLVAAGVAAIAYS